MDNRFIRVDEVAAELDVSKPYAYKNVDRNNRFRSITVGFRVSPEEQEELNRAVALSGLPKQEYCYRKCMEREVVVQPNPRVYKALKTQMAAIHEELERIAAGNSVPDELLSTIDLIAVTMQGLKGETYLKTVTEYKPLDS